MVIGVLRHVPGATTDTYDAVSAELGVESKPPEGMVVHTAGATGGGMRIFEVWESREAYDRFQNERLLPTVRKVIGEDAPQPQTEIYELHNVRT